MHDTSTSPAELTNPQKLGRAIMGRFSTKQLQIVKVLSGLTIGEWAQLSKVLASPEIKKYFASKADHEAELESIEEEVIKMERSPATYRDPQKIERLKERIRIAEVDDAAALQKAVDDIGLRKLEIS